MVLYTQDFFDTCKSHDLLPFQCDWCKKEFFRSKKDKKTKNTRGFLLDYCSQSCGGKCGADGITEPCKQCGKSVYRCKQQYKKVKNVFCNHVCAGIYNSQHRVTGCRISKLEIWLQIQLASLYPTLEFHFNKTDAIGGELDIYIPLLKLGFELNGIFHYEPIFGPERLKQTQTNDYRKFQAAGERGIGLCVIDTSKQKQFKESTSIPFLNIITKIIDEKMEDHPGNSPGSSV
jgi:hypothetical protein